MTETHEQDPAIALQPGNIVAVQFRTWAEARDFFHWVSEAGLAAFRQHRDE